jgi:hypothetical protein
MKNSLLLFFVVILAAGALAHQPVIVAKDNITIEKPEISRAFYASLNGQPQSYFINAAKPFLLYVNLLVPRNTNAAGRYSARINRLAYGNQYLLAELKGDEVIWQEFYEPFGGDYYLKGPEYKENVPAGAYEIQVYSADNRGKYVLAVGEKEYFGPKEIAAVYKLIPKLKADFFGDNPWSFLIVTPFGLVLLLVSGAFVYWILRKL